MESVVIVLLIGILAYAVIRMVLSVRRKRREAEGGGCGTGYSGCGSIVSDGKAQSGGKSGGFDADVGGGDAGCGGGCGGS